MKVVVTRPLPGEAFTRLKEHEVEVHDLDADGGVTEETLMEIGHDAHALVTLLSDPVTDRVLAGCPKLRIVSQFAVGYDNIDLQAARKRGLVVTNTPGVLTDATADFAFTLLLAAARRIIPADRHVRADRFRRWETDLLLGTDLHGKTLGVVGLGRIGAAVARRAIGFGLKILYHNRMPANPTLERVLSARRVPMARLLKDSHFISLHCSLNEESRHLIDAKAFRRMKSSAVLVNTSRGAVVDEHALVEALKSGEIAAAGLDVFEDEPSVHAELKALDNVVLAPHLGSATIEARTKMADMCVDSILAVFGGAEKIPHRVV